MSTLAKIKRPLLPAAASEPVPESGCSRFSKRTSQQPAIGFLTGNKRLREMDGLSSGIRFSWLEVCNG